MTPAQTGVDLGTIVCSVKGMLAEEQIIGCVIPRMQEVELRIFQAKIFIHTQRDFRSAKVISPISHRANSLRGAGYLILQRVFAIRRRYGILLLMALLRGCCRNIQFFTLAHVIKAARKSTELIKATKLLQ